MNKVIITHGDNYRYPYAETNFRPDTAYPEYLFQEDISPEINAVYEQLRQTFILAKYDIQNVGRKEWNPLGRYVHPGDTVLIKPNFVMDYNPTGDGTECLFTQPGLIAAVVDYILIAFQGVFGKIVIGDAPMQECNFDSLKQKSGLDVLVRYYEKKGIDIQLVDFRGLKSTIVRGMHHSVVSETTKGTIIDLGNDSEFKDYSDAEIRKLRITNYDPTFLSKHHAEGKHEYFISDYLLTADVVINMPKPKTHRKAGITGALKNMVGINVRKEFLPHHTMGAKDSEIGDEYQNRDKLKELASAIKDKQNCAMSSGKYSKAQFFKLASQIFIYMDRFFSKDYFLYGSWYGNETISKTICDLNKILMFANKRGIMQEHTQRRLLVIADMIVSGEKEGPIRPSKKMLVS